jgi:glycosyltransferase involved in cell wall biosynthesis
LQHAFCPPQWQKKSLIDKELMKQNHKIDLFVVSVACHAAINRKIYQLFAKDGITVAILLPKFLRLAGGTFPADPEEKSEIEIIPEELIGSNSRFQIFKNEFKWLNLKRPKQILLDNDPISLNAVLIGIWCCLNGAKLSCISCENLPIGIIDGIKRKGFGSIFSSIIKKLLMKCSIFLVNTVFTINNEGTEIFLREGFRKVVRIPLGFDPEVFHLDMNARARIRRELGTSKFLIGFFGRVTREKGILILLESLEQIKNIDWYLVMDEFSHYKTEFNKIVNEAILSYGLQEKIIFINPSHSEMGDYMNAVDLVVMPSIKTSTWVEQYGRVASESMACGKVVAASRSGALPMLIDRYGILFSEGSVQELKLIIQQAVACKDLGFEGLNPTDISKYAIDNLSIHKQKEVMQLNLFQSFK